MAKIDSFLKVDGIEGESQDATHKGEIDILSWSITAQQSGTSGSGGGGGAGKARLTDFSFKALVSKASPTLFLACATGQPIKKALLTCRKAGGKQEEYLKITLTDVIVSSITTSHESAADLPTDHFSLNFGKIEKEYREQKPDGSLGPPVKTGFDVKNNKRA